ncbi:hypothetical protein [Streptomyces sp. 2BBP-J2]|nr:hypothetical protein [Streptomyces sp. 2BBP-J2]
MLLDLRPPAPFVRLAVSVPDAGEAARSLLPGGDADRDEAGGAEEASG